MEFLLLAAATLFLARPGAKAQAASRAAPKADTLESSHDLDLGASAAADRTPPPTHKTPPPPPAPHEAFDTEAQALFNDYAAAHGGIYITTVNGEKRFFVAQLSQEEAVAIARANGYGSVDPASAAFKQLFSKLGPLGQLLGGQIDISNGAPTPAQLLHNNELLREMANIVVPREDTGIPGTLAWSAPNKQLNPALVSNIVDGDEGSAADYKFHKDL